MHEGLHGGHPNTAFNPRGGLLMEQRTKRKREDAMSKQFNLKPLEDRVVVKASEEDEMTASGLVIPDTAKERPQEGQVMAAGPGRFEDGQRIPMEIKVGDKVVYSKYGGTEVKVQDEEYLILSAHDVLAVIH